MKKIQVIILVMSMVMSFCACSGNGNGSETDATDAVITVREEKIINLQMREADVLDPVMTQRRSVRDALMTVYEPLFNINEKFELVPVLAESYAFNEGATIMTLKIKAGVLWHNGQQLSSEDIIYTCSRIKENVQSSYYENLAGVERVEKLNDYEVVFYLTEPDAFFAYSLYFPIMRSGYEPAYLMGTGPFKLKESDGKSISLIKNEYWHNGEVLCDGVKFLYMRTSAMAQEAFSSGKIHAVTREMLDVENFAIKEENTRHLYPDGLFEFMGFNAESGIFTDPLIRIAAANAIDRSSMSNIFGDAVASGFPIMPGSSAFSPSYEVSEYNLDYAREVIFSAGWVDTNADGRVEKVVDNRLESLSFELLIAQSDSLRQKAAEEVKVRLENAGFTVSVKKAAGDEYRERIENGEYDAFLGAVYYGAPYDVKELLSSHGRVNHRAYSSAELDMAITSLAMATDVDKVSKAFSDLQSLYLANQPITGLVFRQSYVVTSPYVTGTINPYPYSPYANIAQWDIKGIAGENEDLTKEN